ncbi:hypothetical protein PoB_000419400 [Plakobranchus ocellatus]|uniref:Uncharacterized protein n=1 Tax=Plakobranchus ocellatus TaxID=259542 RepID=A0AAV3Y602_9GAST|nr:hypothetical protein PoB_000419400 [Plakobranchus ocellatus]
MKRKTSQPHLLISSSSSSSPSYHKNNNTTIVNTIIFTSAPPHPIIFILILPIMSKIRTDNVHNLGQDVNREIGNIRLCNSEERANVVQHQSFRWGSHSEFIVQYLENLSESMASHGASDILQYLEELSESMTSRGASDILHY